MIARSSPFGAVPTVPHLFLLTVLLAVGLAVATQPLRLVAAGAAAALLVPLGLARPVWLLAAVVVAVPFGALVPLGGSAGGLELALAAAAAVWALQTLAHRRSTVAVPPVLFSLAAWVGVAALSTTLAEAPDASIKETLKWAEAGLALLLAANLARGTGPRRLLLLAVLAAASAEALLGAYQFATRTGPEGFLIGSGFLRAHGTFGQPNPFAGYLALVVPLTLAMALERLGSPRQHLIGLGLLGAVGLVLCAAVGMSLSRGAWIALAGGTAVVLAVHGRGGRLALAAGAFGGLMFGLAGMFGLLPAEIVERLEIVTQYAQIFDARTVEVTPQNFAIVERMAIWQAAWAMFNDAPLWGVGIGNFDVQYLHYALRGWNDLPGHAHNFYLTLLAETGVLGLATFSLMYVLLVGAAWRAVRRARRLTAPSDRLPWAIGALGMLTVVALHNLFDSLFVHGIPVHLGLVLGIALAPERTSQQEEG